MIKKRIILVFVWIRFLFVCLSVSVSHEGESIVRRIVREAASW